MFFFVLPVPPVAMSLELELRQEMLSYLIRLPLVVARSLLCRLPACASPRGDASSHKRCLDVDRLHILRCRVLHPRRLLIRRRPHQLHVLFAHKLRLGAQPAQRAWDIFRLRESRDCYCNFCLANLQCASSSRDVLTSHAGESKSDPRCECPVPSM